MSAYKDVIETAFMCAMIIVVVIVLAAFLYSETKPSLPEICLYTVPYNGIEYHACTASCGRSACTFTCPGLSGEIVASMYKKECYQLHAIENI